MMEHLHRDHAKVFIQECKRVLKPGGFFRLVVPNLQKYVDEYNKTNDADKFLEGLLIQPPKTKTIKDLFKLWLSGGYREHQWMYDKHSLEKIFLKFGFTNIKSLPPGKTGIVGEKDRHFYERENDSIYIESQKPFS